MSDFDDLLSGRTPKAATKRRKGKGKGKAPCKYGPRDEDGRCPKKPPTERQAAADKDDDDEGLKGFAKDVGRDILKDLKRKPRRRRTSARARRRTEREGESITRNTTGKSVLTKVAPLAARLTLAAAVVGATWWTVKTLEARAVRKRVEAAVAATEARLKRPLTKDELAALLPQYERWFKDQQQSQKIKALTKL